jgi:hypothetical protein
MTTVIDPRVLVAGGDHRKVAWTLDVFDRAGIRRPVQALSATALGRTLAANSIDFVVLTAPMFEMPKRKKDRKRFDANTPSFVILAKDEPKKERWKVHAVVDAPTHPLTVVAALMKTLRERDQVGYPALRATPG